MGEEVTTIQISKTTVQRLKQIGRKGETYDRIIQRLLKIIEKEGPV
jgi:hypothetical protein